jgi:hypothetical protein
MDLTAIDCEDWWWMKVVSFGVCGVEPLGSAVTVLLIEFILLF